MTIQMLEEGIKNNDMGKIVKGFNSITGKNLSAPVFDNENISSALKEINKKILTVKEELAEILEIASLQKSKENKELEEEDKEEHDIEEEEEDDEDEDEESVKKEPDEFAIDEDGNQYRIKAEEAAEKEIFGKEKIKTKFVTNEPTEEEILQNKKNKIKKDKKKPVNMKPCLDCGEETTSRFIRKGETMVVCAKCQNKRIKGKK